MFYPLQFNFFSRCNTVHAIYMSMHNRSFVLLNESVERTFFFFLSKLCFSFSVWSIAKLNVPPSQWDETINDKILCGVFDCLWKYFFWTRTTHGLGGKFSFPETSSWSNTWSFKLLGVLTKASWLQVAWESMKSCANTQWTRLSLYEKGLTAW